jgi:hypothetical protein
MPAPWSRVPVPLVRFDVVAVIVALHGENSVRVILADAAFGFELGAAVDGNFFVDHEVAGAAFLAVLSVEDAILNSAGKFKFVGGSFSVSVAGYVRGPIAVVAGSRY